MKSTMNKQQLASKIWAGANELRGKVSASSYKDYMLGLIFYKYLSEKEKKYLKDILFYEEEELSNLSEADVKNCQENLGFFIETNNLFSYWKEKGADFSIGDVRVAISSFNRLISKNYKKVYDGIFDTLEKGLNDLGSNDSERTKALMNLTDLIEEIPVDGNQEYDVLGFIYEFLLKNFAANAGKAGEFYTPHEASTIMSEIIANHLKDRDEISIYDPTSGSGSLLINIGKSISRHLSSPNKVKYYAQELIPNTFNLTRMNLVMRNILPDNITVRNGDTLKDDWPFFEDGDKEVRERTYDPVFVDGCCSNPPYSQKWDSDDADIDVRFKDYGVAPRGKADYAFLLHNLYHLKPDGIVTIVMPHGVLFRGGDEAKIREKLIENNNIETIIGLPANMFFGTGIPTIIIVLKKNRKSSDILFIDASKGFIKEGNKNKLRARDIRKIVDTAIERNPSIDDIKFARLVTKEEIVKNEYNLNIPRYVDSSEKTDIYDLYATMYGGIPNYEIDDLDLYWKTFPSLRNQLFEQMNIPYSNIKVDDIKKTINENNDVINFVNDYKNQLNDLPSYLKEQLIDNCEHVSVASEEYVLAKHIKDMINPVHLIDYYDSYQILDDNWNRISLDLELIQTEGTSSLMKVDANMVSKKNSKTKELYEVQDGWVGHIMPFDLIQDIYFKNEKAKLDQLILDLESEESNKSSLLESMEPEDKESIFKDDEEEIDSKKFSQEVTRIKKDMKKGNSFDVDSYEDLVIRINNSNESIKSIKSEEKALYLKLEEETKKKIENLSLSEAFDLLIKKWINPLYGSLANLPNGIIDNLAKKVKRLKDKYEVTFNDISKDIKNNEKSLCKMIDELDGNEFDMKGLDEFKNLINGE